MLYRSLFDTEITHCIVLCMRSGVSLVTSVHRVGTVLCVGEGAFAL